MTWGILGIWIAVGLTLFMYSFLYKDNPLFKVGEHLYLGVSIGYIFVRTVFVVLKQKLWAPTMVPVLHGMRDGDPTSLSTQFAQWATEGYPKGVLEADPNWWLFIPLVLGVLVYMRLSGKLSWMSRYTFAFIVGFGSGVSIPPTISASLLQQLWGTAKPWFEISQQSNFDIFSHFVALVGVICTVVYFLFSIEHRGPMRVASRIGIYFLMISFGATFGYTVMGRMSLFVGRLDYLRDQTRWEAGAVREYDIMDGVGLCRQLAAGDGMAPHVKRMSDRLSTEAKSAAKEVADADPKVARDAWNERRSVVVAGLNAALDSKDLHDATIHGELRLADDAKKLLEKTKEELTGRETRHLNRRLLEASFPGMVQRAQDDSPFAATWACLGLVVAWVAVWELCRKKTPSEGAVH